jgi:hypothetical protein
MPVGRMDTSLKLRTFACGLLPIPAYSSHVSEPFQSLQRNCLLAKDPKATKRLLLTCFSIVS